MTLWYACEEVECPPDAYTVWHYAECSPCRVKAEALYRQYPEDEHVTWLKHFIDHNGRLA